MCFTRAQPEAGSATPTLLEFPTCLLMFSFLLYQLEQRTFHKPVHLLYNNVRYDPDNDTASFLILESDWEVLHADTVLVLISSSMSYTSQPVELKRSHKGTRENACYLMNEDNETKGRSVLAKDTYLRSKRLRSRLARNFPCVNASCMSGVNRKSLQKYDSCYQLDVLTSQDLVIHNSAHVHSSTESLFSTEKNTGRFFQKGIDSPCFQVKGDTTPGKKVSGDVIVHSGGQAINHEGCNITVTTEQVDGITQSFGLLNVTWVMAERSNSDDLEVKIKQFTN